MNEDDIAILNRILNLLENTEPLVLITLTSLLVVYMSLKIVLQVIKNK